MRLKIIFSGIIVGLLAAPAFADYSVQVGYADNLRASPFFPSGLCTGTYWNGATGQSATCLGQSMDSGAIQITNTGATTISVTALTETNNPIFGPNTVFNIWGALTISLAPGQNAVFTQTGSYNFDSSDQPILFNNDPTNNCSTGPLSIGFPCSGNAPIVTFTVDGVTTSFNDTGFVLDTGGYDSVNSNPCIGGNNANNAPGGCNESLQWRLIGTTGVQNPGGGVPEPATLALVGLGLAGLALRRRR